MNYGAEPWSVGARTTQDSLREVRPPQQCTVKVTGLSEKTSKDLLTNYFENAKRSKGGPISRINLDSDLQECLITFESPDGRFNFEGSFISDAAENSQNYFSGSVLQQYPLGKSPFSIAYLQTLNDCVQGFHVRSRWLLYWCS